MKMALAMDRKKRPVKDNDSSKDTRHVSPRGGGADDSGRTTNGYEARLVEAIDNKNTLLRLEKTLAKLADSGDVQGAIQDVSPEMMKELLVLAMSAKAEKVKLAAIQDLLDRAGFGKVTKHAVARFNANDSKEAIISRILGAKKDLGKVGIEITDEDQPEDAGEPEQG